MMFSILPLNIGDAFCFICLPNLTDFATSDLRATQTSQNNIGIFQWLG